MPSDRRGVTAWILYDVAVHGYGLMIPSRRLRHLLHLVRRRRDRPARTSLWSLAVAPVAGHRRACWRRGSARVADSWRTPPHAARRRRRSSAASPPRLLSAVGRGDVRAGDRGIRRWRRSPPPSASSLYNSFLPMLAPPPGQSARLSGLAWGLSYLGGIACFLLCLPFDARRPRPSRTRPTFAARVPGDTAAFLLVLGLPADRRAAPRRRPPGANEVTGSAVPADLGHDPRLAP